MKWKRRHWIQTLTYTRKVYPTVIYFVPYITHYISPVGINVLGDGHYWPIKWRNQYFSNVSNVVHALYFILCVLQFTGPDMLKKSCKPTRPQPQPQFSAFISSSVLSFFKWIQRPKSFTFFRIELALKWFTLFFGPQSQFQHLLSSKKSKRLWIIISMTPRKNGY